ncbi:MAG: DUF4468 domain-containing protein [Dysgonamonadaceae bacterium]|jgi:hypothetical protein|nr:DUF4468 domain-containing protein [Dysgonamonadaceae bacterium]
MKKCFYLLSVCVIFAATVQAQVDKKYLSGAVPEVNGKVVFSKLFELPGVQQPEVYKRALAWAEANYDKKGNRQLLYAGEEDFIISCRGNDEIIFHSRAFSLDKTDILYQLNIYSKDDSCQVEIKSIHYKYPGAAPDEFDVYKAETWITDKEAIRKKTKLYKINGKFRIKTIDLVEDIFNSLGKALQPVASSTPTL